ncbi:uncharacterized protein EAF01_007550 [Botrytis porri]|uniref:Uncharacterized protein n=1 Tax=Botrytis porri TaxID=87229 RepID=A0A4Z1KVJ2_9HELO|nr:uncharacterized protein EAF01_007550 [Botrytis porri]KAF7900248.1 hypothetical protein EAF01_007550 [Botrytis porri]TGO88562.1 hypothetical protein BPOR_0154g00020 [Botrytis porri]
MDQHSSTNSFGKRDNDDPSRREEYPLRSQREEYMSTLKRGMWEVHQDSRRDTDSYASGSDRNQSRRVVDSYRPDYRRRNAYYPRVPHRNHAARHPLRLGPGVRETTTQGSQASRFNTVRTSLSNAAGSTDTSQEFESAPPVSHPVEAAPSPEREVAPSSRADDEHELISSHAGGPLRRFTKKMCDIITESITEDADDYMSAIEILGRACNKVAFKTGATLQVHDCWLYWRKKIIQSNIRLCWPESLSDVDKEVEEYRQLKVIMPDTARAAYATKFATTPVIAESSASAGTTETMAAPGPARTSRYWPQVEKDFLFEQVKNRRDIQHVVKANGLWIRIGIAMKREGYTRTSGEYREWFKKHGRRQYNYNETLYYSQSSGRRVSAGRMQHEVMTPEDTPVGDAPSRRRRGLRLNSSRVRPRVTMAQRSPPTPRTPKPVKPRMSSVVIHDIKSVATGYRIRDRTAKAAGDFPLPLITPSTGERFEPFTTEPLVTYDNPPSPATSPPGSPLFVAEDEPQIERDLVPSARNSTTSRLSPPPALTDSQVMLPDETTAPEEALEPGEIMTSDEGIYSGDPTTSDERIGSRETIAAEVEHTPSLQANETENVEDCTQWVSNEWGFVTSPTMRPSEMDDMAQIDNHIDFRTSHIPASTNSSDPSTSTAPPFFDDSLTSNETIEEAPLPQPVSTSDVESEIHNGSESETQLLREQQERTDLEISNLRANYLRVKEAEEDDRKKLDDIAEELDIVILRRAEQLESQTANLAEMQRIEAELQEKEKVKQALSNALEELEFYG